MKCIKLEVYTKNNGKYELANSWENTKENEMWLQENLIDCLYSKYIFKRSTVKRIYEKTNYNGTRTLKEYLDNDCIYIYTVEDR